MKSICKYLLIIELIISFTSPSLFLLQGLLIIPIFVGTGLFYDGKLDLSYVGSIIIIIGGMIGLFAIIALLKKIINPKRNVMASKKLLLFLICGILALTAPLITTIIEAGTIVSNKWNWQVIVIFIIPLLVTFHFIYLGRDYLFLKE
jgi:uncharacterized membrane protein